MKIKKCFYVFCIIAAVLSFPACSRQFQTASACSIQEVVDLYNSAANGVKAYTGTLKLNMESQGSFNINELSAPSLKDTANKIIDKFTKPITVDKTYHGGKADDGSSIYDVLPVTGQSYMSRLEPQGVALARKMQKNGKTIISFTLVTEQGSGIDFRPPYHSSCVDTIPLDENSVKPFTVEKIDVIYKGAVISAQINEAGQLERLSVNSPVNVDAGVSMAGMGVSAKGEGTFKINASFEYM